MQWLTEQVQGKAGTWGRSRTQAATAESRASHDVAEAQRLIADGVKCLGLEGTNLKELPGSDPRKIALAAAVHARTTVPQGWTAEKLSMSSAGNVSQLVRRLRRDKVTLGKAAKVWLARLER